MRKTWLSRQHAMRGQVEFARRGQIAAEGLLDHHPAPAVGLVDHSGLPEAGNHLGIDMRRDGQVVEPVGAPARRLLGLAQMLIERQQAPGFGRVAAQGIQPPGKGLPGSGVKRLRREGLHGRRHVGAESLRTLQSAGHAQKPKAIRQPPLAVEMIQSRDQLAPRQVAGGAEDHQCRCVRHNASPCRQDFSRKGGSTASQRSSREPGAGAI